MLKMKHWTRLTIKLTCILTINALLSGYLFAENNQVDIPNVSTTNEQQIVSNPDGSVVTVNPDGAKIISNPDGSSVETKANGTQIITHSDGSTIEIDPEGGVTTTSLNDEKNAKNLLD